MVIPIHNGIDLTARCLDSVVRSIRQPDHIVIVDDGSTDGSPTAISKRYPRVEIVEGDGNLWWGEAMNRGVHRAAVLGANVYLALNNDCTIQPTAVGNLLAAVERAGPRRVAICSQVRRWPDDNWIMSAGGRANWWWKGVATRCWGPPSDCVNQPTTVDWFPGMGSFVQMADYLAIGGYDSHRFPHYRADVDFSLRLRRFGCTLLYEPASVIWNDTSQTGLQIPPRASLRDVWRLATSRRSQYNLQETAPFFWRHAPKLAWPVLMATYYGSVARALVRKWR